MSDSRVHAGARRVAVVTGAARGIGQAIALRLAEAGHAVVLGDVRPADETAKQITNGGGDALSVPCDLGTGEGVELNWAHLSGARCATRHVLGYPVCHRAPRGRSGSGSKRL